jgi:uncharacterized protein YnzC (UPF0291/DUF896 family)
MTNKVIPTTTPAGGTPDPKGSTKDPINASPAADTPSRIEIPAPDVISAADADFAKRAAEGGLTQQEINEELALRQAYAKSATAEGLTPEEIADALTRQTYKFQTNK